MLSESEGGKEEGIKKLEVGSEERKEEKEGEREEEKNQNEKEEKKEEEVIKEGIEEVISKLEESIEGTIEGRESVDLKEPEETKNQPEETENQLEETENRPEETKNQLEETENQLEETENQLEETENQLEETENRPEEEEDKVSSDLASLEDQKVPPAPVVQSISLTVQEPLEPLTKEPLEPSTKEPLEPESEEPLKPSTKEPLEKESEEPLEKEPEEPLEKESEEGKEIEPSKLSEQESNTDIETIGQSADPVQVSGKEERKETTKPLGTPVSKKETEQSKEPIEESKVSIEESKVSREVSKSKQIVEKMKQSPLASPSSNTSMKPGTPINISAQSPRSATPSPAPKVPTPLTPTPLTPLTPGGQMQQIVVVSSGQASIVSSGIQSMASSIQSMTPGIQSMASGIQSMTPGIQSMTPGSMSFTSSPHNMVTVQNAMMQQQQMLMGGQGMGMVNQSMMTNPGGHHGHGSHPIQIVPQGTFLSPAQPMYIQSPTMFANNPNQNLITIQQPFLTQGGLSLQLPQSMTGGNVGGVNTNMGGVNTNMGAVGGVNTNLGGVNTVGGVNNGAKIAMPKNMTGMGGVMNTMNKPGVSTVVNSSGQQVQSQSGQSGLRPIFSSQYNQGSGQFLITQQPNQSFVLSSPSGHQLINSQQSMNKSLSEGVGKKGGVILSKNQTILPSTGTFSGRPVIPNLFQQQTFLQSPFPQLTQWPSGQVTTGHQQLFNGQPQLIIRNHQSGDQQQFQYITNPMGQPNTLQFVQSGQSFATTTNQLIQQSNQVGSSATQNSALVNQSPGSNGGSTVPTMGKVPSTPPTGSPEKKLKPLAVRPNMSTMSTQTAVGAKSPTKIVSSIDTSKGKIDTSKGKIDTSTDTCKGMKSIKAGTKGNVQTTIPGCVQGNQVKGVVPKATSVAVNTPLGKNGVAAEKGSVSKESTNASKESRVSSNSGAEKEVVNFESKSNASVQICTPKGRMKGSKTTGMANVKTTGMANVDGSKTRMANVDGSKTTGMTNVDDGNIQRPPYKRNVPVQKVEEFNAKAAQMHQQAILAAASGQISPSLLTPSILPPPLPTPKTTISTPKTTISTPVLKTNPTPNLSKTLTGGKNENKIKTKASTNVGNADKVPQTMKSHVESNLAQNQTDKRGPEVKMATPASQTRQLRATRMRTQPQPEVLRHVIENYIIEESSHPFPVDGRTVSPDKLNGSTADGKGNGSADGKGNGSADGRGNGSADGRGNGSADQRSNGKVANGNHDMNGSKPGFDSPALSPDSGSCSSNRSDMGQCKEENVSKDEKEESSISPDRCGSCCRIVPKWKFKTKNGMRVCPTCFNKRGNGKSNNQQLDLFNRVTSPSPLSEYDFKPDNPTAISAGSKAGQLTTVSAGSKAGQLTTVSAGGKAGQLTTVGRQLSAVDRLASDHHHDEPMGPTPAKKAKGKKQTVAMETTQVTHVQTLPVTSQAKLPPTPTTPGTFIPESGTDLQKWNVQDVYDFVRNLAGCEEFADEFKSQEIDGQALLLLKEEHLMSAMGMKLGPALKLFKKIQEIKSKNEVN